MNDYLTLKERNIHGIMEKNELEEKPEQNSWNKVGVQENNNGRQDMVMEWERKWLDGKGRKWDVLRWRFL